MDTKTYTRAITLEPAEGESVPAVLSSDAPVPRGGYDEILKHTPQAIDLSRFPLPLLVSHDREMLPIGVAESPRIEGGKLRALITFGTSDLAQQVLKDVKAKVIRSLSVGYTILEDTVTGNTVTATRWMPFEASVVAAPADIEAGFFRSISEDSLMPTPTPPGHFEHGDPTPVHGDPKPMNADPASIRAQERKRYATISDLCSRNHLSAEFANGLIDSDLSLDAARGRILDAMAARSDATATASSHLTGCESFGGYGATHMREAARDALLQRAGFRVENPHPQSRNLANVGVVDMARTFLAESGDRIQAGSPSQLLQRAMTTSDFAAVLEQVADKSVLSAFYNQTPTHFEWSVQRDAQYYRPQHFAGLQDAPALAEVLEGGEYTYGPLVDRKEVVGLRKFGKIVSLTWEALARDDLSVFSDIAAQMASAARSTLADFAYATLESNPVMEDGTALFHADHGNLAASGSAISVDSLDAARLALRGMKGANGHYRDITPRILLVPEAKVGLAQSMIQPFNPTKVSDIRPSWLQNLMIVSDPRLSGNAWYLLGDLAQPAFVRLTLGGNQIETFREDGFEIDGTKFKVRCVHGFGAIDAQAAFKNPGA